MKKVKKRYKIRVLLLAICLAGYIIPHKRSLPLQGMSRSSYDQRTFWYYPWGPSVVHKGADIFAEIGRPLHAVTSGLVIWRGSVGLGGNVVMVLGPQWHIHYYAHLSESSVSLMQWVNSGELIGKVGDTGNAKGRPPHLHYSICTPVPYLWQIDFHQRQWYWLPFFVNPVPYLNEMTTGPDRRS